MFYKSEDQNYKMTDFELKVIESKKILLGENVEENGSEAISFDTEVKKEFYKSWMMQTIRKIMMIALIIHFKDRKKLILNWLIEASQI